MIISTEKTKSMVIAKEPVRCKLMVDNKTIEQVIKLNYLGSQISSSKNLIEEVKAKLVEDITPSLEVEQSISGNVLSKLTIGELIIWKVVKRLIKTLRA